MGHRTNAIFVVVCIIPYPVYLYSPRLTQPLEGGLMRCATLSELEAWLKNGRLDLDSPPGLAPSRANRHQAGQA